MDRREVAEGDGVGAAGLARARGGVHGVRRATGVACTAIGPGGAFWISTVSVFTHPISVQVVGPSRPHATASATAAKDR